MAHQLLPKEEQTKPEEVCTGTRNTCDRSTSDWLVSRLGYLIPHADPRTDREGVKGAGRFGGDDGLPAEGQELKWLVMGLYSDIVVGWANEAIVADYGPQLILLLCIEEQ